MFRDPPRRPPKASPEIAFKRTSPENKGMQHVRQVIDVIDKQRFHVACPCPRNSASLAIGLPCIEPGRCREADGLCLADAYRATPEPPGPEVGNAKRLELTRPLEEFFDFISTNPRPGR